MSTDSRPLTKRLYQASAATLLTGLPLAIFIYLRGQAPPDLSMVDDFQNSKAFQRALEVYGGKMSLLGDQLNHWFTGLWEGKQLGITIGCITLVVAFGLFLAARHHSRTTSEDLQ